MIKGLLLSCLLLLSACATQDSRWSAYNSQGQGFKNTGNIEYNGIGGSGRQAEPLPENGLGGSGIRQAQANGLGGSGRQAPDSLENGLGGSGKQGSGKAAILGPISAFGSIWVNDRHIQLPESTEYLIAGKQAQHNDLRLGQMVAVLADSIDDSDYQALEVHLLFNVVGKLETIAVNSQKIGKLDVMGQTVRIDETTRIVNNLGHVLSLRQLKSADNIAISGLRMPNQEIKATLLIVQSQQAIQLAGPVSVIDGQYWLAKQKLAFNEQQPELDQPLRLQGEIQEGIFVVENWAPLPHNRIFELADEVWLEGFPLSDAEFFIEGFEVQLPEFTDDLFDPNDSMRIGIDMEDQEFWMDHEPPENDMDQWQDQWQQDDDAFMRRSFAPEDNDPLSPEDHDPSFQNPEFNDQDFYPPEHDHHDNYYPDDFYPEDYYQDDYYPDDHYPDDHDPYDNRPPPR